MNTQSAKSCTKIRYLYLKGCALHYTGTTFTLFSAFCFFHCNGNFPAFFVLISNGNSRRALSHPFK